MTILLIEDDPGIALLMQSELEEKGYQVHWVEDFSKADHWLDTICEEVLMIVDYSIAGSENAQEWITGRRQKGICNPPFIMSTGQGDERIAVEMMKLGARDYLVKDSLLLDRLPDIIKRLCDELEKEHRLEAAEKKVHEISEFYKNIIENATDGVVLVNEHNKFVYISSSSYKLFGYVLSDTENLTPDELTHPDDLPKVIAELAKVFSNPNYSPTIEYRFLHKDGNWIWIESTFTNLMQNPAVRALVINFRIIEERKLAEKKIEHLQLFRQLLMDISTSFINLPIDHLDTAIMESLRKLALFVNADRSYIFEYDFENQVTNNTYEWCNDGIHPEKNNFQAFPMSKMEEWPDFHSQGKVIYIPDLDKYKEGSAKEVLKSQKIKSLIAVPLLDEDRCIGFTGFDSVKSYHQYNENEQNLLRVFAQVLVNIYKRKQALLSLRKSEEKYRELFANNPQPMWIFDSETLKFLEINDAACKHYGYSCDEFLAMDITMIRPKEEMHILYANLERMNKGVRTEVYARHLKKDGSIIEVELTSSPTISNGRKAMHVMVNDITERKIANERLQKSRDILNKLLLESSELIQTTNSLPDYEKLAHTLINISEARFVSFNLYDSTRQSYRTKAMAGLDNYVQLSKKILGFNLLEHEWKEGPVRYFNNKIEKVSIYKNVAEISGKQIPGLVVKLIENTFNTGKVVVVTITNMEEILGHFLLIYPKNKQPENLEILELYGSQVGQFITRKRTEEKVLESEKKYRYLFTSNPQPMWIYDVETLSYIEVNDAAIRHYGYSLDEFMKMTILDIRPKDEKEQIIESVRNQGEMDKSGDWTHIKKNGERILVEITSYSVVVNGRKARHVLINDITERRKAEIALKEKMDELLRFHKVTVGRELTMIELKKEINTLLKSAGKEEKYRIV